MGSQVTFVGSLVVPYEGIETEVEQGKNPLSRSFGLDSFRITWACMMQAAIWPDP